MVFGANGQIFKADSTFDGTAASMVDVSIATTDTLRCGAYLPSLGRWVTAGDDGNVWYSDDTGDTWTAASSTDMSTNNYVKRMICVGNDTLVAFFVDPDSSGDHAGYAVSSDGNTWTAYYGRLANVDNGTGNTRLWGVDYHAKHGVLFVGSGDEVFKSLNG